MNDYQRSVMGSVLELFDYNIEDEQAYALSVLVRVYLRANDNVDENGRKLSAAI